MGMIYTDQDVVDEHDQRKGPFFKPDFDHDRLMSQNYVNHLAVYEAALLRAVGGFREGFEGSQDYDLVLRVGERLRPDQIGHIPRILYHWRAIPGSVAADADAKPYAHEAARRAIREHLARRGVTGAQVVEAAVGNWHRVIYPLPDPPPRVSVVIPTRDRADLLGRCLGTLFEVTQYPDVEVVVVDNGSTEAEVAALLRAASARWPVRVLRDDGPFNFSRLNNRGVEEASGDIVVLLNNDIEIVEADWMREMASHALRPEIGIVGARLLYGDGSVQHAGVALGVGGIASHYGAGESADAQGHAGRLRLIGGVSAVTGACLAIRRDRYRMLGGMDEALPVAYNDVDFCLRARDRGWRVVYTPHATLIHHESRSRGYDVTPEKARRLVQDAATLRQRWPQAVGNDPFYNPNLSRRRADFSLGDPVPPPYGTRRTPADPDPSRDPDPSHESDPDVALLLGDPLFDARWYRNEAPGLPGDAAALARHYLGWGWRDGLDPSEAFSTAEYLEEYPDVKLAGLNPLLHFLRHGRREGRLKPNARAYARWLDGPGAFTGARREALLAAVAGAAEAPRFSVVMPVYDTPADLLEEAIASVREQIYAHWELCIADDRSTAPHVRRILERAQADDPRIRVAFREANGHIAAASNTALSLATGDFVALLDHDDRLAPQALLEMAASIVANPAVDILYSDEDKIDGHGRRFSPHFKPAWSPELLLSQNYVSHLGVYRRSVLEAIGGFRSGFDGSQDYDLLLRAVEAAGQDRVRHVPAVLYHWRAMPGSVALASGEKPYAHEAARRAIAEHLARHGTPARVVKAAVGECHRAIIALPDPAPRVTAIVPTRDRLDRLRPCITGLLEGTDYPSLELIVVDNGSTEPETLDYLRALEAARAARVLRVDEPFNFARLNNLAAAGAGGTLLALVNNDVEPLSPDWLREMAVRAVREGVGAVGAKLLDPQGRIAHAGVVVGADPVADHAWRGLDRNAGGYFGRAQLLRNVSAVTAACMVTPRAAWEAVGGMDERFAVAYNDVDYCFRLRRAGMRVIYAPQAELLHRESSTRGREPRSTRHPRLAREASLLRELWGGKLEADPYDRTGPF
jgi:GT2 family glycosyltransferase